MCRIGPFPQQVVVKRRSLNPLHVLEDFWVFKMSQQLRSSRAVLSYRNCIVLFLHTTQHVNYHIYCLWSISSFPRVMITKSDLGYNFEKWEFFSNTLSPTFYFCKSNEISIEICQYEKQVHAYTNLPTLLLYCN